MAGLNDTALNAMADELASLITHLGIHTADPGTTGTNPADSSRQACAWDAAASGSISLSGPEAFTGGAASGAATFVGCWNGAGTGNPPTGGTFYAGFALTGDQTFNAAGEYNVTDVTINGADAT